jgi:hypothetical protein
LAVGFVDIKNDIVGFVADEAVDAVASGPAR